MKMDKRIGPMFPLCFIYTVNSSHLMASYSKNEPHGNVFLPPLSLRSVFAPLFLPRMCESAHVCDSEQLPTVQKMITHLFCV